MSADLSAKRAVFLMCNPSTADEQTDDVTTRILQKWASTHDYGQLTVVNLFAYRATVHTQLLPYEQNIIVGPKNDEIILRAISKADVVIAAWGDLPRVFKRKFCDRLLEVERLLESAPLHVVGRLTRRGNPRHPRRWYLEKGDVELHEFDWPVAQE